MSQLHKTILECYDENMKIVLASVGTRNDEDLDNVIGKYTNRIDRYYDCEWLIRDEESKILNTIKDDDYVILLDERGEQLDNFKLANKINNVLSSGKKKLYIIIGSAYGASELLRSRADYIWSLSDLVFPHMLVRAILAEQLYRSITILKGEKYHHE